MRPAARHPRNSGCGRAAETESAPRPQRQAGPKPTAGRNIRRIALAFEAGRDGFWLELWRLILFRKIPEYPVSGTDGSNPSSSSRESANHRLLSSGRGNVVAGTDCGLGGRVHANLAWAKLRALGEGARLAVNVPLALIAHATRCHRVWAQGVSC